MHAQDRAHGRRAGPPLWLIVVGCGVALLLLFGPAVPRVAGSNAGAIWTTRNDCGIIQQDVNHYAIGEMVYINGANFNPGSYSWQIKGQPGHASLDPGQMVASGSVTPDEMGSFCFWAYTVQNDDGGEYQVKVGTKGDNYRVDFPPTATPTATATPTETVTPGTPTETTTPTKTTTPTNTPRRHASRTPTRTWTPRRVVSAIIVTRERTAPPTLTMTPTLDLPPTPTAAPSATATPVVAGVGGERTPTARPPVQLPGTGAPADGFPWLWLSGLLLVTLGLVARRPRRL